MYRVIATCIASLSVAAVAAGCSTSSPTISSGYASNPDTVSFGTGSGLSRTSPNTRVAALNDQAPAGSYEKAPVGALADRDYTGTRLDVAKARDIINQYRVDNGLKPLRLNADLSAAAKAHARDLAKWDRISHYGSDGSNPWDRVKRTGYKAKLAAENVGTGQVNFEEVMRGWKASPGHNKNLLLADAEEMGLALVNDPKTEFKSFWTLVLGSRTR